ncbi:MAG TPA: hypothetical protein VFA93_02675 [Patescibacteria group bacterium]|nr:hypothetical protein [Patescibacteria group bacterium]
MKEFRASKRQRFIVSVLILSIGLFISEYFLGRSGIFMVFALSSLAAFFLYLSLYNDLEDNFYWQVFILPFFYSLAFGLFYLLVPARFLTRVVMTSLYALGLYSLFLSTNIFTVSSIRTIALLTSARTVSFAIMLLSYFFLSNVVFSLHINALFTLILVLAYTFPMVLASVWFYTLDRSLRANFIWTGSITLLLMQVALVLWFWASTPTLIALFITGMFYTLVGLSQAWFEKRLFRGVILEYFWVSAVAFFIFIAFSSWF